MAEALVLECKIKKGIEEGSVKGIVQSLDRISNKRIELVKRIVLNTNEDFLKESQSLKILEEILKKNKGNTPLFMDISIPDKNLRVKAKLGNHFIKPTDVFIFEIENTWPGMVKVERLYQLPIQHS